MSSAEHSPFIPQRPVVSGKSHAVAAGHQWAALAGYEILEAGGNAVDAGVATAMATNILEPEMCHFFGIAPMLVYIKEEDRVTSLVGIGTWPEAATSDYYLENHGGNVPKGILSSLVPAAPSAYIAALQRYGTMSFGEVAQAAQRIAAEGFPYYDVIRRRLYDLLESGSYWHCPSNDAVYRPNGRVPFVGENYVQPQLGKMLQYLIDEEKAHAKDGRERGLMAVRDAIYRGDIAQEIIKHQREEGGLLAASDLASYETEFEEPATLNFRGIDVYSAGGWCLGPVVLQCLGMLRDFDLEGVGHNSAEYIHLVVEALKLSAADREAYFGDKRFVDVPLDELLSENYLRGRAKLIDPTRASPGMPPAGVVRGRNSAPEWHPDPTSIVPPKVLKELNLETSYLGVVDKHGNAFSATVSDSGVDGPVIASLGVPCSNWGNRSYTAPGHPGRVEPGKRPRSAASPQFARYSDGSILAFGTPGAEVIGAGQLQAFLNMNVFGMDVQSAVEAPRVASHSWPGSRIPHKYEPGKLNVESRIPSEVGETLNELGHKVTWWPERHWQAGSVCMVHRDEKTGLVTAGADHRRAAYAIGR